MISINRKAVRAAGGTQSDELAAKIKSVTSSTTVGAVFVYDTRNDSDSGAWRKKARGSWYYETLNTATRGGRREFPSVALIVADGGSTDTLSIYDLDDVSAPLWMVFEQNTGDACQNSGYDATSVFALNGQILVGFGTNGGLRSFNFADDSATSYRHAAGTTGKYLGNLAERNDAKNWAGTSESLIVNSAVNDVAATVLEGAEIGALGLPIPTIAVATAGGVSVIHPNGSVADGPAVAKTKLDFTSNGSLLIGRNDSTNSYFSVVPKGNYFADGFTEVDVELSYAEKDNASASSFFPNFLGSNPQLAALAGDGIAVGCDVGLNIYKHNSGNKNESAVAYVTSTYNTGYMLGDIRLAVLGGYSSITDRSVKGNNLTQSGTIVAAAVATDAELSGYSNFSASNYLSRAYDADFDFGTGNFSVMFWCNLSTSSDTEAIVARYAPDSASPDWLIAKQNGTDKIRFLVDGTNAAITANGIAGRWAQVCVLRRGSTVEIYVNGKLDGSGTNSANLTNTSAVLGIGIIPTSSVSNPLASTSSLSLIRISATAPTPQQVKDIYEAEKPLFRAGAKCLLQSDGGSPSLVNDLSYDSTTGLLHAYQGGTNTAETRFKGLEAVDSYGAKSDGWSASGATGGVAAGGVKATYRAAATGGVIVDLPAIDMRGDLNTADTKLPDDGKIHFSGVTTNATPTVIGQIPIAEDEQLYIKSVVNAGKYRAKTSERASFEVDAQFVRKIGDDVNAPIELRKLSDEQYSTTFDVEWERDTASNTARLKVTGVAGIRVEWSAELTVQRISEKTYER